MEHLCGKKSAIDHITVVCLVAWPLNESEAGGDLALVQTFLVYYANYANGVLLVLLIRNNLHQKTSEVSIKTRSPPASLSFKGQETKHTTVKWSL